MLFRDRVPEQDFNIGKDEINLYDQYLNEYKIYKDALTKEVGTLCDKGKILEIGSNLGYPTINVLKDNPNLEIVVLESNPYIIQRAKENIINENLLECWRFVKGDKEHIPFNDNYFDAVMSINSMHHWKDPVKVIQEIFRVLKKGGHIFINDLRRDADENIIEVIVRDWKGKGTVESAWFLKNFVASWRASYIKDEVARIIETVGIIKYNISNDGPMTQTIKVIKE